MKKVKMALLAIIFSLVVVVVFQNQSFFMNKQNLHINLYFVRCETPFISNFVILLICFLMGIIISLHSIVSNKLKFTKIIKELRHREASVTEFASALQEELDEIKNVDKNR